MSELPKAMPELHGSALVLTDLVHNEFKKKIEALPEFLMTMDDRDIEREMKFTPTDRLIRHSFWREYAICCRRGYGKITFANITHGICDIATFKKKTRNDMWLAWLLKPMREFEIEAEALLHLGTARMWDLLGMDIMDKHGVVDPKRGALLLSAFKEIKNTVKGQSVQRMLIRSQRDSDNLQPLDDKAVEARIKEIEAKVASSPVDLESLPKPKEVDNHKEVYGRDSSGEESS